MSGKDRLETDVLVVGGGSSGIPAAVGAARAGARVLLVEDDAVLGGTAVDSFVSFLCGGPKTGFTKELEGLLQREHNIGATTSRFHLPSAVQQAFCGLVEAEPNITVLTGARAVDVLLRDGAHRPVVTGVKLARGAGQRTDVVCAVAIDATGSGAVAQLAGCATMYGRDSRLDFCEPHAPETGDETVQDCTWMYVSQLMDPAAEPLDMMKLENVALGVMVPGGGWYHHHPDRARAARPCLYLHWGCKVKCRDTRDPVALGAAQAEALQVMEHDLRLLRENGHAVYLAPKLGVREGARIIGEHVITENDLRSGVLPADTIAVGTYGLDIWGAQPSQEEKRLPGYGIPYRAIVPRDVDGLLLAGRSISGTHIAMSAYRVQPIVGSAGQAAGVAAQLCVEQHAQPRALDPQTVRARLRGASQNVQLDFEPALCAQRAGSP